MLHKADQNVYTKLSLQPTCRGLACCTQSTTARHLQLHKLQVTRAVSAAHLEVAQQVPACVTPDITTKHFAVRALPVNKQATVQPPGLCNDAAATRAKCQVSPGHETNESHPICDTALLLIQASTRDRSPEAAAHQQQICKVGRLLQKWPPAALIRSC